MRRLLRSSALLFRWRFLQRRAELVWIIVLQGLVSVGVVLGFGFLQPDASRETARFIVTGAITLNVAMAGLVVVPQNVSVAREQGTFDYLLSLPVPRLALLFADLANTVVWSIPGVVLALGVGGWRYGFSYDVSLLFPLAFVTVAVTGAGVGYALAVLSPSPQLTMLLTQVIIFGLFLFSPIAFPDDGMPAVLRGLHAILPVRHMADSVRHTLTGAGGTALPISFAILGAWATVSLAAAHRALIARR